MNKTITYLALSVFAMTIVSCGGNQESEEENVFVADTNAVQSNEIEQDPGTVENLDNETFSNYLAEKGGLLIDVRTADEFADGHIEGAVNKDYTNGDFEAFADSLDTMRPVFVYCQAGGRSGKARDMLVDKDFLEVYNLENGYGAWEE